MIIQRNEPCFQLMVEASPTALILVNKDGKISYLNHHTEKLFLYNRDELIGQDLGTLIPEKFRPRHSNLLKKYFLKPENRMMGKNLELFAIKKDGKEFPVEIGLTPIATEDGTLISVVIIDNTERMEANEQFRIVVESAPNAMILVNSFGSIVMINKKTEKLFGYTKNELLGENMEILVPDKHKKRHFDLRQSFNEDPQTREMGSGRDLYAIKKKRIRISN